MKQSEREHLQELCVLMTGYNRQAFEKMTDAELISFFENLK